MKIGWINVEDRLPDRPGRYLVSRRWLQDKKPYVQIVRWSENLFMVNEFDFIDKARPGWYLGDSEGDWEVDGVTHWMPLPEPAEDFEHEGFQF